MDQKPMIIDASSSTVHRPPSASFLKATLAVVRKDLTAEFRSRELLSAMLVFSLLVILIFNFALELDPKTRQEVTSGVLWTTFAFAGTLGLNRSMAVEKDRGCLDGLLLAPVDRAAIYVGKVISNLMVDLNPSNAKLKARAVRLLQCLTVQTEAESRQALSASNWNVRKAALRSRPRPRTRPPRSTKD